MNTKEVMALVFGAVDLNKILKGVIAGESKPAQIAFNSINVSGIVDLMLDKVINDALNKVVEDSTNSFDNTAKEILYPLLSREIKKSVNKWIEEMKAGAVAPAEEEQAAH